MSDNPPTTTPPVDPPVPGQPYTRIGGAVVDVKNVLTVGVGASGSFSTPTGLIVTVQNGIITNIY